MDPILTTIEDLEEEFQEHNDDQRYDIFVMVTSEIFDTNDFKTSVWVEDPHEAKGVTIMCAFKKEAREMLHEQDLVMNGQYMVRNALVQFNKTKVMPTYATLQIVLDKESSIEHIEKKEYLPITYDLKQLSKIVSLIEKHKPEQDPPEGIRVDILVIPELDYGRGSEVNSPRRIRLIDKSERRFIWTLWGKDTYNDDKIASIMNKPIVIRRGIAVKYERPPYKPEYQIRKDLGAVRHTFDEDEKLGALAKKLEDWYIKKCTNEE